MVITKLRSGQSQDGFTIAELLLASAVFAVVLLIALSGFLQIGHLFYKGVSTTQTQNINKQIVDDISAGLQTADSINTHQSYGGWAYACVGNTRYTYSIGRMVDFSQTRNYNQPVSATATTGGNFGLIKDSLAGSGGACATPCNDTCAPGQQAFSSGKTELLGNKMRLEKFEINNLGPNLYGISVKVAYGDDDTLDNPYDPDTVACKGDLSRQKFCSVDSLSTSVYRIF